MTTNAIVPHCYWCLEQNVEEINHETLIIPLEKELEEISGERYKRVLNLARTIFQCETFIEAAKLINERFLLEPSLVQEMVPIELRSPKKLSGCDPRLVRGLFYLAKTSSDEDRLPLPKKACTLFKKSEALDKTTKAWVGWKAIVCLAVISVAGGASANLVGRINYVKEDKSNKDLQIFTVIAVTVLATFLLSYLGLVWTGTNPVNATSKAHEKEQAAETLRLHFRNLASTLIHLYRGEPKLGIEIADSIDMESLRKKMEKIVKNEDLNAFLHLNLLEQAIIYVKSQGRALPLDSTLRMLSL